MKVHFELLEVEPLAGLGLVEVVVEISRCEAERVELLRRREEDRCRSLLVDDARVPALPAPHHVDLGGRRRASVVREAERVAAVRRAEVDRHDHEVVTERRSVHFAPVRVRRVSDHGNRLRSVCAGRRRLGDPSFRVERRRLVGGHDLTLAFDGIGDDPLAVVGVHRQRLMQVPARREDPEDAPVSYTHLTLPTILRV